MFLRACTKTIAIVLPILIFISCSKEEVTKATITIDPLGDRVLSDIAIRKVKEVSDQLIHFEDGNFAGEETIDKETDFAVDPALYYVSFTCRNISNGVVTYFGTNNSSKLLEVQKGDTWVIKYGYSGSEIYEE